MILLLPQRVRRWVPTESLPDIGSPSQVEVRFPLADWDFSANFQAEGSPGSRVQTVEPERTGPTAAALRPAGRPGRYEVTSFGRGEGDLFVSFRWTTPGCGPMPVPEARLALLADHDGVVDSYGLELEVSNLAASPASAAVTITVTSANGRSLMIEPSLAPAAEACGRTEGSLYWDGPDDKGLEAAALGPAPFRYETVLVLDGVRHVAKASWPDDVIPGNEPSVALALRAVAPGAPRLKSPDPTRLAIELQRAWSTSPRTASRRRPLRSRTLVERSADG